MKQSVGSVPMYTVIAFFIVIIFTFLAATMSYYKAFKMNAKVSSIIERCEGYNSCSSAEIERIKNNYGYNTHAAGTYNCPKKSGGKLLDLGINGTCIYYFDEGSRYSYGVVTFMTWELPIIGEIVKMPIFSKTDRLYKFK